MMPSSQNSISVTPADGAMFPARTQRPANVRFVGAGDERRLFDFVVAGHEESATFPLSENRVRHLIDVAVNRTQPVIIGVIDAPEAQRIAASICIVYSQQWYTEAWHLDELWCNVHKDYRKSRYGQDLIDFGKWVADSAGKALHMGIITTHRMEAKIALYRRKMQQVGAMFIYNLEMSGGPAAGEVHHGGR